MNEQQWEFLNSIFLSNSVARAVQRANAYAADARDEAKQALRAGLKEQLQQAAAGYYCPVTDEQHLAVMANIQQWSSNHYAAVLEGGVIRLGIVQKALNLYLKFLWCAGKIPVPPHCPIDKTVVDKLPRGARVPWTKIKENEEYMRVIRAARIAAARESLSEWELGLWNGLGD